MQKTLLILGILVVTLFSTACVNKFAVQELNNNAKALIAEGRVDDAIARLESSIDLDEKVFETHYNLAVVYIQAKKYDKAIKSLEKTIELNPDFADAYYSMGVVYEDKAVDIINGEVKDEDGNLVNEDIEQAADEDSDAKKELTDAEKTQICDYITTAIDYYNKYLSKNSNADDKDKVNEKIESLNKDLVKYSVESPSDVKVR